MGFYTSGTAKDSKSSSEDKTKDNHIIQRKLRFGEPDDKFEQEADKVADAVVGRNLRDKAPADALADTITPVSNESPDKQDEPPADEQQSKQDAEKDSRNASPAEQQTPVSIQGKGGATKKVNNEEVETLLKSTLGGGEPLEPAVLAEMERSFGKEFKQVRVHRDAMADMLCKKVNAVAFAYGHHIYFTTGSYDPSSAQGKRLLAHELTHVVQQSWTIQTKLIQRTPPTPGASPDAVFGTIDEAAKTLTFDELEVAEYKIKLGAWPNPIKRTKNYKREVEHGAPQATWKSELTKDAKMIPAKVIAALKAKASAVAHGSKAGAGTPPVNVETDTFVFKTFGTNSNSPRRVIGKISDVARELTVPTWNKGGNATMFNVDHLAELQLGGADDIKNMALIKNTTNRWSGIFLSQNMQKLVKQHLESKKDTTISPVKMMEQYDLIFKGLKVDGRFSGFDPEQNAWKSSDITAGKHFDVPNFATILEIDDMSKLGDKVDFMMFPDAGGWIGKKFKNKSNVSYDEKGWLAPWTVTEKLISQDGPDDYISGLRVELKERGHDGKSKIKFAEVGQQLAVTRYPGAKFAGFIDKIALKNQAFSLKAMSPVVIHDLSVGEGGVNATGIINPTLGMIKNAVLDLSISEGDLTISKTFHSGELKVPSPFKIDDASLTILASSARGIGLEGQVDFQIKNVGKGFVKAAATTGAGFEVEGEFNFDTKLFEPAKVKVSYKNDEWKVEGELGIPAGKVKGIKKANIKVLYESEQIKASGTVEPDIKGIKEGKLDATLREDGFTISGELTLGDLPGIQGGTIKASVDKTGEEYKVKASGSVKPKIPGIDVDLSAEYDNGALTLKAKADYNRGKLSGSVNVGVTNRAKGPDGQPTGEPTDDFIVYGGGSITMTITPWLKGTIGVQFKPDGSMEVSGRLGIPAPLEVFKKKEIRQTVFSIGIDIPIFGIPVGPKTIGLKATISGSLDTYAFVGPGTLEELAVDVTYNPDKPDDAKVHGKGSFKVPAEAGLSLTVNAAVGLSVLIGGVEGGGYIRGTLGLASSVALGVEFDWSPSKGFELNAEFKAEVMPKFKFDIGLYVLAWFLWYKKRWEWPLAGWEWGPEMKFGVIIPVKYVEGQEFNLDSSKIKFEKPNLDASSTLKSIFSDLRGQKK